MDIRPGMWAALKARGMSWLKANDAAQDLLEYALLAGLLAVVAVGAVANMGGQIQAVLWQTIVLNF